MTDLSVQRHPSQISNPLGQAIDGFLRLFSSVWLGVFLAVLLFVYCTIGSAIPAVRQHPALEMTEFEWFNWWPFNLLIVLLCLNLVVATIRRIPLGLLNLGVWMIHGGIIVLCIGSYYYFGTKVEGDAPVFRRRVQIQLPGMASPQSMPALPGNQTGFAIGGEPWRFQIQGTNSNWPILSDEHQGETAYAVNVLVTPPSGDPFIRQLLSGYPQYTEDIIPGQGRAIKSIGRKLVDEDLRISLDYEPQEYFHLMDTWALYVRRVGEAQWRQRPIHGLPRYHDRIGSREQVFADPHYPVTLRAIDLPVRPGPGGDALSQGEWNNVRITGYLRYAQMRRQWREGGEQLNPVVRASLISDHGGALPARRDFDLVALDRGQNRSDDGLVQLVWLSDFSQVDSLPTDSAAMLHIEVPKDDVAADVPINAQTLVGAEGPYTPIEGTDFAYRIQSVQDDLVMPGQGSTFSVAIVGMKGPDGEFTRMVADRADLTRDMHGDADPHGTGRAPQEADPRIHTTYQPRTAPILLAAHPKGVFLAVNGPEGRLLGRDVDIGETVDIVPGLSVRVDSLLTHAASEVKPYVVPPPARQRNAGETFAMIRIEVNTGQGLEARWLRFNQYALPNARYAYGGRFAYSPEQFSLPDGGVVEVIFSRERRRLPSPIALEEFELDTHIGGYTGQSQTIRNYVSQLRFLDEGEWTAPTAIRVNAPTEHGGFWYFQSTWDKPPTESPNGGMNYTGLGVGNRNGVYVQLAGCALAVAGMLFAFYVKPTVRRRRDRHLRATGVAVSSGMPREKVVSVPDTVEV